MSRKARAQTTKPRGKKLPGFKTGYKKQIEGRQLEAALNQAMRRNDFDTACQIADIYIDKYQSELSYRHLVVVAEIYLQRDHFKKAHDLLMAAMKLDANSEMAPEVLFWVHHKRGDRYSADKVIKQLLETGPKAEQTKYRHWEALAANLLSDSDRVLEAFDTVGLPSMDNPRYHELMFSYLMALIQKDRMDEALETLDSIPIEEQKKTPNLPMVRAQIFRSSGDRERAIDEYTYISEKLFNGLPEAIWNRALCRLELGDLKAGWADYLRRFEWKDFPSPEVLIDAELWAGQALDNKRIVIWAEQGLGDQILFLTLAIPLIRDPSVDVTLAVHPKLLRLVSAWYPDATVIPLIEIDCRDNETFKGFDYHLPMGSLPYYFLSNDQQLRSRPVRFMKSDVALRETIYDQNKWSDSDVLVGICWRSSVVDLGRSANYLGVNMVKTLRNNLPASAKLMCLQYKLTDEEKEVLAANDVFVPDADFFDDVFSHGQYVGVCDYVVTPGTITKQLAGLFDVPTFTWGGANWSSLGQREYPWYRSLATFKTRKNYSQSSLVYQIGRWLNLVLAQHEKLKRA